MDDRRARVLSLPDALHERVRSAMWPSAAPQGHVCYKFESRTTVPAHGADVELGDALLSPGHHQAFLAVETATSPGEDEDVLTLDLLCSQSPSKLRLRISTKMLSRNASHDRLLITDPFDIPRSWGTRRITFHAKSSTAHDCRVHAIVLARLDHASPNWTRHLADRMRWAGRDSGGSTAHPLRTDQVRACKRHTGTVFWGPYEWFAGGYYRAEVTLSNYSCLDHGGAVMTVDVVFANGERTVASFDLFDRDMLISSDGTRRCIVCFTIPHASAERRYELRLHAHGRSRFGVCAITLANVSDDGRPVRIALPIMGGNLVGGGLALGSVVRSIAPDEWLTVRDLDLDGSRVIFSLRVAVSGSPSRKGDLLTAEFTDSHGICTTRRFGVHELWATDDGKLAAHIGYEGLNGQRLGLSTLRISAGCGAIIHVLDACYELAGRSVDRQTRTLRWAMAPHASCVVTRARTFVVATSGADHPLITRPVEVSPGRHWLAVLATMDDAHRMGLPVLRVTIRDATTDLIVSDAYLWGPAFKRNGEFGLAAVPFAVDWTPGSAAVLIELRRISAASLSVVDHALIRRPAPLVSAFGRTQFGTDLVHAFAGQSDVIRLDGGLMVPATAPIGDLLIAEIGVFAGVEHSVTLSFDGSAAKSGDHAIAAVRLENANGSVLQELPIAPPSRSKHRRQYSVRMQFRGPERVGFPARLVLAHLGHGRWSLRNASIYRCPLSPPTADC